MKHRLQWLTYICLFLIVIVGGLVRFYQLGVIPSGITDDEANAGYDAYSLLKTGKDQWNTPYPIFSFKGFGDYRSPVYTYLILPLLPFMDMNPFWLRFPAALLGTITILLVYGIAKGLKFSTASALIAALLFALNPWHIGMSRTAMVIVVGLFFLCLGLLLLLYARKRLLYVIFSCIFFGITIYAYPAYLVITPIVIGFSTFILFKEKHITKRQIFIGLTVCLFTVIPYIFSSNSTGVRMGQVNIFRDTGTMDLLNEKLGTCRRTSPKFICTLTYNRFSAFGMKFAVNYVRHFSPDLLFSNGTATQYSVLPERGLLLFFEYIFFIIGIFYLILNGKNIVPAFLLTLLLFAPVPDSLTGGGHYGRYFVVLPFIQLTAVYGIGKIIASLGTWVVIPIVAGILIESAFFGVEYLTYFPYAFSRYSHFGYEELSAYLVKSKDMYDDVYVSGGVNDAKQYIFYIFYTKYDPMLFQNGYGIEKITEPNGWIRVQKIGNIHFIPRLPEIASPLDEKDKRILYIAAPSEFSNAHIPSVYEIHDKRGDVLFRAISLYDWKRCLEIDCREDGR